MQPSAISSQPAERAVSPRKVPLTAANLKQAAVKAACVIADEFFEPGEVARHPKLLEKGKTEDFYTCELYQISAKKKVNFVVHGPTIMNNIPKDLDQKIAQIPSDCFNGVLSAVAKSITSEEKDLLNRSFIVAIEKIKLEDLKSSKILRNATWVSLDTLMKKTGKSTLYNDPVWKS